jgi:predicted site-specific integrase-resolvase
MRTHLPTGTVIVRDGEQNVQQVHEIACIYARVSSSENKNNLNRLADR